LIGGTSTRICKPNLGATEVEGGTAVVVIMGEASKAAVRSLVQVLL
jgi:hypothetical protein